MRPVDPGQWTRQDWLLASALALVVVVPRAVLRSRGVFTIDSALLALGVQSYDFASYHPHPPYYPLTIAAAKMLAPLLGPVDALTALSLASIAALALAVYGLARDLGGRAVGAFAAGLVALSPVVTANAGVPLSYASEGAASALVAWLALRARATRARWWWIALGVGASIAVGLRASAAIQAGPLVLWAARDDGRGLATTCVAGLVATALWFIPALVAGGGWDDFAYGLRFQSDVYVMHDPVWVGGLDAVRNNVAWVAHHASAELALLGAISLLLAVSAFAPGRRRARHPGLLAAWGGPALLFYCLVYAGWPIFPSGYLMGLIPVAFVAAALGLRRLLGVARDPLLDGPLQQASCIAVAVVAALPIGWAFQWDDALRPRDAAQAWADSWDGLDEAFPPNETALLAGYAGQWVRIDRPEYLLWIVEAAVDQDRFVTYQVQQVQDGHQDKAYFDNVRDGPDDAHHAVPSWVRHIVVVQGHPFEEPGSLVDVPAIEVTLRGGAVALVIEAEGLASIEDAIAHSNDPPSKIGREQFWPA